MKCNGRDSCTCGGPDCPSNHLNDSPRGRVFEVVRPTGISYADRTITVGGDYKKIAFLPFSTLVLEWSPGRVPADVRDYVKASAAEIQARRGEGYVVSGSGQTVRLGGGGGHKSSKQLQAEIDKVLGVGDRFRVLVRVDGAQKPVQISSWMTREQAMRLADNHRSTIKQSGGTHSVEVEDSDGMITRLPRS